MNRDIMAVAAVLKYTTYNDSLTFMSQIILLFTQKNRTKRNKKQNTSANKLKKKKEETLQLHTITENETHKKNKGRYMITYHQTYQKSSVRKDHHLNNCY